jgi:small subunit ribosomal protein S1
VRHPSKILNIGDEVDAIVLKVDQANEKISLGLKQVEPDPWLTLDERFPLGTKVTGKVRNLTNFGAFVELEEGIDGLVHVSDMSWTRRVSHPSEVVKKGDVVDVAVLAIDKEHRLISLGLKQVEADPWPTLADRYLPGTTVVGKVTRLFDRGAIVDVGEGIEGFIPISQLGVEDLKKPSEGFLPNEELQLKVTRVDVANHRLLLSIKAWLSEQDDVSLAEWMATRNRARAEAAALEAAEEEKAREREERKAKKTGKDAAAAGAEEGAEPLDDLEAADGGADIAFEDLGGEEPGGSGGTAS